MKPIKSVLLVADNPAFAVQVALIKSRTSIDKLVATLRKFLERSSSALTDKGAA